MRIASRLIWVVLALWGCDDADPPATAVEVDAGPDAGLLDGGAMDGGPADGALGDATPDAEVFEVFPVTCPPVAGDERMPHQVNVEAPGSWWLDECDTGWVELRFTVPPRTAWRVEATSGADMPPIVAPNGGENRLDMSAEGMTSVFFETTHEPIVTIRWAECASVDSCGADRYCSDARCTPCADGDELFDTRMDPAPRTDAMPRALVEGLGRGAVCAGFDDWYEVEVAAGQPLRLPGSTRVQAYLANPGAQTLDELEPLPFAETMTPFVDAEPIDVVRPADVDRTVWLRVTTDEPAEAYQFDTPGCQSGNDCASWWYCDPESEGMCRACDGQRDVHGDDNIRYSPDAAPIPLVPGLPLDGAVCGADEDWYAIAIGDPASRVQVTGTFGEAYLPLPDMIGEENPAELLEERLFDSGEVMVLRRDQLDSDVIWVQIGYGPFSDVLGTEAYTILVEDGDFCLPGAGNCPEGQRCDARDGLCIDAQ